MEIYRQLGMTYIDYSRVAANIVRKALKPEFRAAAQVREESFIKLGRWQDGKSMPLDVVADDQPRSRVKAGA